MNHRNRKSILLVDNSQEYRNSVIGFLKLDGYDIAEAGTVEKAQEKIEREEFDLVLVDIRMQDDLDQNDVSGLTVAKFASERGIPCIIVTAFPTVELARAALRALGAEPYAQDMITKGSDPQAVLASINATLKPRESKPVKPVMDGFSLDLEKKLVSKNGILLNLSRNQYTLLEALYKKDGGVCGYAELIRAIYAEEAGEKTAQNDKRLRNLVDRTKEKIEDKDSDHEYIEAVPGRGYRLNLKK